MTEQDKERRLEILILGPNSKGASATTVTFNILLGCTGIVLNSTVVLYYLRRSNRGKTVPFMYTIMSICNIVTCILAILHAAVLILDMKNEHILMDYQKESLIMSGYVIYCIVTKASMLHNLLLSIIRSINIWRPFQIINWHTILHILLIFYALWLTIATMDIIDSFGKGRSQMPPYIRKARFQEMFRFPQPGQGTYFFINKRINSTLYQTATGDDQKATFTFMFIFMITPALIMLSASLHQCYTITEKDHKRSEFTGIQNTNSSKLTITILILSLMCLITNAAYESFYFLVYIAPAGKYFFPSIRGSKIITYYFTTTIHVMHAVLEPFVFIFRGKKLRSHFLVLVRRLESSKSSTKEIYNSKKKEAKI